MKNKKENILYIVADIVLLLFLYFVICDGRITLNKEVDTNAIQSTTGEYTDPVIVGNTGAAGITAHIMNVIDESIESANALSGEFHVEQWIPFDTTSLPEDEIRKKYSQVEGTIYCRNGGILITFSDFKQLVQEVFVLAGDLSYETQCAVAGVIFNRVKSPNYSNDIIYAMRDMRQEGVPIRIAFPDAIDMGYASMMINYPDQFADVVTATEDVLNDEPSIIDIPDTVTEISTVVRPEGEIWEAEGIDGLYFYHEPTASISPRDSYTAR